MEEPQLTRVTDRRKMTEQSLESPKGRFDQGTTSLTIQTPERLSHLSDDHRLKSHFVSVRNVPMRLRLISYNIHKGIGGVDRKYRPERIAETLAYYHPDILFLQEVDDGVPRSRGHRQSDWLGDALGMPHRAYQSNVKLRQGHYGNAILSSFPLSQIQNIELTVPLKKRRRALAARCRLTIDQHQRTLVLINMHLGLAGYERSLQLRKLLRSKYLRRTWKRTPTIIGGDLNDVWGTLGKRFMIPAGLHPTASPLHTFPAFRPVRPLDRLFFRGSINCVRCFRSHSQVARFASDHLPLIADFWLR